MAFMSGLGIFNRAACRSPLLPGNLSGDNFDALHGFWESAFVVFRTRVRIRFRGGLWDEAMAAAHPGFQSVFPIPRMVDASGKSQNRS